jgi:hypothetical protein
MPAEIAEWSLVQQEEPDMDPDMMKKMRKKMMAEGGPTPEKMQGMMRKKGMPEEMVARMGTMMAAPMFTDSPCAIHGQANRLSLTDKQKQQLVNKLPEPPSSFHREPGHPQSSAGRGWSVVRASTNRATQSTR